LLSILISPNTRKLPNHIGIYKGLLGSLPKIGKATCVLIAAATGNVEHKSGNSRTLSNAWIRQKERLWSLLKKVNLISFKLGYTELRFAKKDVKISTYSWPRIYFERKKC
jgi:hypothetical protein